MKKIDRGLRFLLPMIGLICIFFPTHVTRVLPFLLGGAMLLTGISHTLSYLSSKAFLEENSLALGQYIILVIMGVAFLCKGPEAIGLMGITWGLLSLRKATEAINVALRRFYAHRRVAVACLDAIVRVALSLALLFDPFEKFAGHIVLLGVVLILVNIKLPGEGDTAR